MSNVGKFIKFPKTGGYWIDALAGTSRVILFECSKEGANAYGIACVNHFKFSELKGEVFIVTSWEDSKFDIVDNL